MKTKDDSIDEDTIRNDKTNEKSKKDDNSDGIDEYIEEDEFDSDN